MVEGTVDPFNRVIDAAYATALDFKFSVSLAAAIQALPAGAARNETLMSHLARARQIAAERSEQTTDLPRLVFESDTCTPVGKGAVPVRSAGDVAEISTFAGQCLYEPGSWAAVQKWLELLITTDAPLRVIFTLHAGSRAAAFAQRLYDTSGRVRLYVVFPPQASRDEPATMRLLQRSLGLSERQAEIALAIAAGMSAEEISREMGITPHTVRDHTKAVYDRLSVRKQIDVANVVSQLSLLRVRAPLPAADDALSTGGPCFSATNFVVSPEDGRRICYSEYGRRSGTACVMFHSSFGGRWMTEDAARLLWRLGLRLFIVERPGIGLTGRETQDRFGTSIADVLAVLDHAGAARVHGLSFSGGAFYLAEAAHRHPERFASAHFISPRAFRVSREAEGRPDSIISVFSGLPDEAAELINEAANCLDPEVGWREVIHTTLAENPVDIEALEKNPDLMQMHVDQHRSNLVLGANGVSREWAEYGADFNPPPAVPGVRYTVSGGDADNLVGIRRGIEDWSGHFNVAPIMIPGAAHLVFLTHTEDLLTRLKLA
jgi:pimeloyl-ACP methyl ester carboxylesterase/DNA-binding CsgD family transcriptional regulator